MFLSEYKTLVCNHYHVDTTLHLKCNVITHKSWELPV